MRAMDMLYAAVCFAAATTVLAYWDPWGYWAIKYDFETWTWEDIAYRPQVGNVPFLGDFIWGFYKLWDVMTRLPTVLIDMMSAFGITPPWSTAIVMVASLSIMLYMIYILTGRR